jgi:sugar (pentulose or hexulose) kinase
MDEGIKPEKVIISGGGAMSPLWRQIAADVFNLPVVTVSGSGEGGAYGAALVAGVGVGMWSDLVEASKASTGNIQVNPERCDISVLLQQAAGEYDEKFRSAELSRSSVCPKNPSVSWQTADSFGVFLITSWAISANIPFPEHAYI